MLPSLLLGGAALLGSLSPLPLLAQQYPDKTVRLVVNFPPGGPLDIAARLLASDLGKRFKQTFVVMNAPGAAGNVGAGQVARADPDGYTVLLSLDTTFTMTPVLYPATSVKFEALRPVASYGTSGSIVAVHPSLGVNSLQELITKGRKESINFSTAGLGSPGHFSVLVMADATGVQVNPIHYQGNAPAVLALVSGQVQAGILSTAGLMPHIKAGKVNALALAGVNHSSQLPELKTAAELGQPNLNVEFLFVASVPAGTPDAVVASLQQGIADAVKQPEYQERMRAMEVAPVSLGSEALHARLLKDRTRYAEIVKKSGLKVE